MKIYDHIGFVLLKIFGFYWKLFKREFQYSVRKMRKDEGIVYFDKIFQRTIKKKKKIKKAKLGAVHRPTAEDLKKKGTEAEKEEKEMEKVFDKVL